LIELSLLTWNINQWPTAFGGRSNRRRLETVRSLVQGFDVVCLQEAWSSSAQELRHDFPHHHLDRGRSAVGFGSGLLTLSRYPIGSVRFARYVAAALPDSLASKGISLAVVELPGQGLLHVINTHLQARFWPDVRRRQMEQLDRFVAEHCGAGCALIAGDLNARRASDEFQQLRRALSFREVLEERPLVEPRPGGDAGAGRFTGDAGRIDHLLILPGGDMDMDVVETGVIDDEDPASDHRGLYVRLRLRGRAGDSCAPDAGACE
jgi:endonuclease/exonuclease/phosphatase family metal-dependent hydrolase